MRVEDLFEGRGPLLHVHEGQPRTWQVLDGVLRFIDQHVSAGSRTLETGSGVTTVLFAMKGCHHTCVVPFADEVERIQAFCISNGISIDGLHFEIDTSEHALPRLPPEPLDLILIDGAHGFPVPLIDWYYTANRLRVGGTLIIDDTQLWSVNVLKEFLRAEPEWKVVRDFFPRTTAFEKTAEGVTGKNEGRQPFVVRQTIDLLYPDHLDMIRRFFDPALIAERERRGGPRREVDDLQRTVTWRIGKAITGPVEGALDHISPSLTPLFKRLVRWIGQR